MEHGPLAKLAEACNEFSGSPDENILRLVVLAKELLAGDAVIYNTADGGEPMGEPPAGRICFEPFTGMRDHVFFVRDLQETDYARTDPSVVDQHLQMYMGTVIRTENACIGALCIAYQQDGAASPEQRWMLTILGTLIGLEEQRRQAEGRLRHHTRGKQSLMQTVFDREDRVVELKQEVNALRERMGWPAKYLGSGRPECSSVESGRLDSDA